ncbi:MAG: glycosyltransferase [Anaerolineae bacterium]
MRITILTSGTRGDVQPYVALAKGLQAAGYRVRLAAPNNFDTFVERYGVEFAPLRADFYKLLDSPEGQALKSGNPIKVMQHMRKSVFPLMRYMLDDSWPAAQDADAIIFHPKMFNAPHIGEKLNIPVIAAATLPMITPTGDFPAPGVLNRDMGRVINRLSYSALGMTTVSFNGMLKEWRRNVLGLPEKSDVVKGYTLRGKPIPVLYCYSPHVVPVPPDWDDTAHVTGYWWLEEKNDWKPSPELEQFLAAGAPPVYVGFGSMIAESPEVTTRTVIEALKQSGQRGVIASGWGGLRPADLPPNIHLLNEAPHDWLFPRMAAVVHHGGAGTTAAGLRAGKPSVICPFIADQPFWGSRVAALGAGPAPIPQKKMTAENLSAAIRLATGDTSMQRRAAEIGAKLQAENGVANAVAVLEELLQTAPKPEMSVPVPQ